MLFPKINPYQENIRPGFIGDFLSREHVLAGGIKLDADAFNSADAIPVVVGAAGANASATSIPVDALTGPIPSGTVLDFGGKKFARLSAAADTGDTSIAVEAIPTAVVDNDTAYYSDPNDPKRIAAGTIVGATEAELEAADDDGLKFGPAGDSDEIFYILAYDVPDVDENNDADVLRKGTLIKVNNLPYWDSTSATVKGKIRTMYECTVGAPGQESTPNPESLS